MPTKPKQSNLKDLLIQKLNALYDIELAIVKALPKMVKAASAKDLKDGFAMHLAETKEHVKRLEEAHELLGVKAKKLKSEAIRGLITDGEWVIKNVKPKEALDVNLIRAAQYIEHYEIAGYNGAIAWASTLGENKVAALLRQTLKEEISCDKSLDMGGEMLDGKIV